MEMVLVKKLTVFAEAYFFSVPRMAPERAAAFIADLPLMTFSRPSPPAPPLALLPIRVTLSQSWSAMLREDGLFDLRGRANGRGEVSDGGGAAVGCGKNNRQNCEITVVVA
jgi:hypothetical protein